MVIRIVYCKRCRYEPVAKALAEEIERTFGLRAEVSEGKTGQFDVIVGDDIVASRGIGWRRWLLGRVPKTPKILEAIRRRLARD